MAPVPEASEGGAQVILPDGIKPNVIERVIAMPAKGVALIALAVALVSLSLHWKGGAADTVNKAAQELVREAMTVGTNGP